MKSRQMVVLCVSCALLVAVLAGCEVFARQALVTIENNTSGYVTAVITPEGKNPETLEIDGASDSLIVYFSLFERKIPTEVSIAGAFKTPETVDLLLVPDGAETIPVDPDTAGLSFGNYEQNPVHVVWVVPDEPTTYESLAEVEAAAQYTVENVVIDNPVWIHVSPGTYYVICRDDDGYSYNFDPVTVAIDTGGGFIVAGEAIHPSIAPWLGYWSISGTYLYYADSPPATTNNTLNQTAFFSFDGSWEGSGTSQWEGQATQTVEIAAQVETDKVAGTMTFTYTNLVLDGSPQTPPPQAIYDYAVDLGTSPPKLTLTATGDFPYSPAEPLPYLKQ